MLHPVNCGNSFAPDKDLFHVVELLTIPTL